MPTFMAVAAATVAISRHALKMDGSGLLVHFFGEGDPSKHSWGRISGALLFKIRMHRYIVGASFGVM